MSSLLRRVLSLKVLFVLPWGFIGSGAAAADTDADVADIVVTARKRAELESSVPLPSHTILGNEPHAKSMQSWADLADHVPGLTVSPSLRGVPIPVLRGIGFNNPGLSATSPVAVYVDEGSYPFPAMNGGPMLDIARVEILKGPQGTLFGRNATGGLIHYVTREPGQALEGYARLTAGSWQRHGGEVAMTLPLAENFSLRAAGLVDRSGTGWQRRLSGTERLGRDRKAAVRGSVRWQYSGRGKLRASLYWWHDGSDTQAPQSFSLYPQGLVGLGSTSEEWPMIGGAIGLPPAFFAQSFRPRSASDADWVVEQLPWGGSSFTPPPLRLRKNNSFRSAQLRIDQGFSDDGLLTIMVHHAHLDRREVNDAAGWALENALVRSLGRAETFSQEIRLNGTLAGAPVQIGLAHSRDVVRDVDDAWVGTSSTLQVLRAGASGLASDDAASREIFYGARAARNRMRQATDGIAVFGETDIPLTPQIRLTAGLRYSRDQIRFSGCSADLGDGNLAALLNPFYNSIGIPAAIGRGDCVTFLGDVAAPLRSPGSMRFPDQGLVRDRLRERSITGRLVLDWTPVDGRMLYLSLSRGTKAGSFPNLEANLASQYAPALQERLVAIEGGAKLRWGTRFQLSPSLFYYDYRDKQVFGAVEDILFTTLSRIVNIPRSHAYGLDVQARGTLPAGWAFDLAGAWLKTRIDDYVGYDEFGTLRSFAGGVFSYAPQRRLTATLSKRFNLAGADSKLSLIYRHASTSWADMLRDPRFRIRGYHEIDLGLSMAWERPALTASLNIVNLTNRYRWTNAYLVNDSLTRYAARPRHWALSLTREW